MGSDIAGEPASTDAMTARRVELTESEMSPSSEVIGFAGPGKGLKVLREYAECGNRCDDSLNEALHQAEYASPVSHVTPAAPPIALFGGYGDDGVNIAFAQTLRTFSALERAGCPAFLFGNTMGKYGENPESMSGIKVFFERHLSKAKASHKLAFTAGSDILVEDGVTRRLPAPAQLKDDTFLVDSITVLPLLGNVEGLECDERERNLDILSLRAPGLCVKYYPDYASAVITF